ncbi:hypothetical protein [Nostoc sp.]|uniref:hypothetical protein n=1 Tax=Nostoc sp. TaxID=1180 RepID=UPI002FF4AECD
MPAAGYANGPSRRSDASRHKSGNPPKALARLFALCLGFILLKLKLNKNNKRLPEFNK